MKWNEIEIEVVGRTEDNKFPIIKCNDFGHEIVNGVIPIGVNAKIDTDNCKVEIQDDFLED